MKPIYIIEVSDGLYAGSPLINRTRNRHMAGSFTDRAEALHEAAAIAGVVRLFAAKGEMERVS